MPDADATTDGAHNPHPHEVESYERRHLVRIVASAIAAALGIGYLLNDLSDDAAGGLNGIARVLTLAAGTALLLWLHEIRLDRKLARIEARLEKRLSRAEYWGLYSDVLADLGGIDGETSTDSGRMPPRP